ncbi:PPOX class F420-dependent oxidoreductase [Nocardioides zeae]|uniref:PPOX class F420-dependent oxidoreductase n=1 Tax=Nocardioides zeae TaxID=1457234 RepID=UPI00286D0866|nr:PPOX class F420-dependent oxidoreductase [Nocardioides zeae]
MQEAGQASVCRIGPNVDAITVEIEYDRVVLHAFVYEEKPATSSDLEQIRAELDDSLARIVVPAPSVTLETVVAVNDPRWDGWWHMSIYKAHHSAREAAIAALQGLDDAGSDDPGAECEVVPGAVNVPPRAPAVADEKYVVLTTFTKDGRPKPTPVWIVPFEGAAAVWTVRDSWKVKRVRASGRVQVQGSDVRGKRTHGATYAGVGRLLDDEASARVARAVVRKYGVVGRLTVLGSRLRRGGAGTVGILLDVERARG